MAGGTVFKADGGRGPPLGLKWMEPGTPTLSAIGSFVPYNASPVGSGGSIQAVGSRGERWKQKCPGSGLRLAAPGHDSVWCAVVPGSLGPRPGCLHNCADAAGFGLAAGGGRRGGGLPVVVCRVARVARVAGMGRGQRWVAVHMGPVGRVPPVGAVVVLVCVLDVLGGMVVVVVVVGGRVLLHVAVLGVVPMHLGLWRALDRPLVMADHRVLRVGQARWVGGWLWRG